MVKSILIKKSILILLMVLIIGLVTGCNILIYFTQTGTGTVYVNITNDDWYYDIFLDTYYNHLGTTNVYGQVTFYNVPIGYHTFYAEDVDGWYSGQTPQYIHSGTNFVDIYVYYNY